MKRGDKTSIKLEGKKYPAIYLGRGRFTKAYIVQTNNGPYVVLFGEDCTKDVMALWGDKTNPHVPKIWRYDDNIYLMPYYRPLTKDYEHAWREFKVLYTVWGESRRDKNGMFIGNIDEGYKRIDRFITLLETRYKKYISNGIIEALRSIYDTVVNCGSDCMFEFSPRNLSVDSKDQLVLRDIVFMVSAIKR